MSQHATSLRVVYYWYAPWDACYRSSTIKGFAELAQRNARLWREQNP